MCTIPRLIPRFHFPTTRSRSSSSPSNVTMLIVRRNFDRVDFPPFACLIDPSNASNRISRENSLFKLVEIFIFSQPFDFSYESCERSLLVIPCFYAQSYGHLEWGINSIIMWKWKCRMNVCELKKKKCEYLIICRIKKNDNNNKRKKDMINVIRYVNLGIELYGQKNISSILIW